MRFQAVTGASTNTPSVGGEAGPRPCARGQRTERHRGQGAEVPAAQDTPRTRPPALDGCQEFWVPDEVEASPPDHDRNTPAAHGCLGAEEGFDFPSYLK